ncbi:uncharacterized protein LOC34621115 [Cyclospora cayetanensis]|uniref:Uncharacterized protein LOC34621115 n=1 Tax=Cyclospora cayetanensis TaxID=88456 RepID=A0A6P6RUN9_9EIME|nr:uncharacterized protein LOC34621115 [Cyclospora cayetanensis]
MECIVHLVQYKARLLKGVSSSKCSERCPAAAVDASGAKGQKQQQQQGEQQQEERLDLFFSFAWYGASRLLRCVRAAAWCVPPALLLKDRVFSLERTAVCPYTLAELSGEADLQTPQKQKEHQQHREDGLLSETRRGWFAAVSAPAATRAAHAAAGPEVCGHGCSPSEAASKRSFEEGRQSSWIVVLLSAGEIYRGSAVRAAHPTCAGGRIYVQVVGVPGDVLAVPWREQQQVQLVMQQQLRQPGIESKLVRRKELLLLLERLHQDNEINWQRKRGLALRQRLLQHGQQQQDKRQQPPEADSLRRSEGEHKERQGVIRQHILRLQQEAEAHPKEQQEGQHASDSSDAYLLIRVPPGRCWVETLESSPGFWALPSAATLVEAGAAPAEASAAGSSTGCESAASALSVQKSDRGVSTTQTCVLGHPSREEQSSICRRSNSGNSGDDSFSFGLIPLALIEGVFLMAAPAPELRCRKSCCCGKCHSSTPSDKSVTTFRSMLGGWLESLSRWLSEAAALASLPANMKPTRLPELKDISSKGTMLIIPRSEG